MAQLPLHELELLKRWGNHAEFKRKLQELGLTSDISVLDSLVRVVAVAWFELGREHLAEGNRILAAGLQRATYSRAYYATYNMSKGVRFVQAGCVSLKGDDHQSVGKLPTDFPSASTWGSDLELLYRYRLHADYDNWSDTSTKYGLLTPSGALQKAHDFEAEAAAYLNGKYGFSL